jgi:hypothetical protein
VGHREELLDYLRTNTGGKVQDAMLLHVASLVLRNASSELFEIGMNEAATVLTEYRRHVDDETPRATVR